MYERGWFDWCRWVAPVAACGAAFAQDFGPSLVPEREGPSPRAPALEARVEYGAHPERFGFKLALEGGQAFAGGVLAVEGPGHGRAVRIPVRLDGEGRWERVWRDVPLSGAVQARFALVTSSGIAVSNQVKVSPLTAQAPSPLQRRAVIVREIMKDPAAVSDTKGEWIELVNVTSQAFDLKGWVLDDFGSNHHVIGGSSGISLWALPQVPVVLGINADPATNGGVQVDYKYTNFSLNNTDDVIALFAPNGALVDWVAYDDGIFWPDTPGASLTLRPACVLPGLADDGAFWCDASSPIGAAGTDLGTPGATNDACP